MSVIMLRAEFKEKPSDEEARSLLKKKLNEILQKGPSVSPNKNEKYLQKLDAYPVFLRDQKIIPAEDAERMHRISWAQINVFRVYEKTFNAKTKELQGKALKLRSTQIDYIKENGTLSKSSNIIICPSCKSRINKEIYIQNFKPSRNYPCRCPICKEIAESKNFMTRYENLQSRLDEINEELAEEYQKLSKKFVYHAFAYIKE